MIWGYTTYITEIDGITYVRGGVNPSNLILNLTVEIWVFMEKGNFVFIDYNKQIPNKIKMNRPEDLISFIKEKYPLENYNDERASK